MAMAQFDVILLTDARYETPDESNGYAAQLLHEERLLMDGLKALGLRVGRVAWSNPDFDWSRTRCAVFRSTWDYFHRFPEFSSWMNRLAPRIRLVNSPGLVRWNVDKHYLADLAKAGVRIPPTHYLEPGSTVSLTDAIAATGWKEVILKPAISGAARHTYRLTPRDAEAHEAQFRELLRGESLMLQPFLESVLTEGELSLMVIGGRFTHAVRKVAKPGDFRVQDDHGGSVQAHAANPEEIAFAERAVAACPEPPVYARVDVVRDASGALSLMELELVEPELFFRLHPPAAESLAQALANRLS